MEVSYPAWRKVERYRARICRPGPAERGPRNARHPAMGRLARALRLRQQVDPSADERGRRLQPTFHGAERISAVTDVSRAGGQHARVAMLRRSAAHRCKRNGAQRAQIPRFPHWIETGVVRPVLRAPAAAPASACGVVRLDSTAKPPYFPGSWFCYARLIFQIWKGGRVV